MIDSKLKMNYKHVSLQVSNIPEKFYGTRRQNTGQKVV